jgi:hypothetical protein
VAAVRARRDARRAENRDAGDPHAAEELGSHSRRHALFADWLLATFGRLALNRYTRRAAAEGANGKREVHRVAAEGTQQLRLSSQREGFLTGFGGVTTRPAGYPQLPSGGSSTSLTFVRPRV